MLLVFFLAFSDKKLFARQINGPPGLLSMKQARKRNPWWGKPSIDEISVVV